MSIEEKLKDLILSRYKSIREFTLEIDLPYTTLDSLFRRGINNSSVSNVLKVCKALHISGDALAQGKIVPIQEQNQVKSLYNGDQVETYEKIHKLDLTDEELKDVYKYALFLKEKSHNRNHNKNHNRIDF